MLRRVTSKKKMRAKLHSVKTEMRRRRHLPIPEQGRWLASVLDGRYRYYGVPGNQQNMARFRFEVARHWHATLRRRSQRSRTTWARMYRIALPWLPQPAVHHPWPQQRFDARTQGRSPVR